MEHPQNSLPRFGPLRAMRCTILWPQTGQIFSAAFVGGAGAVTFLVFGLISGLVSSSAGLSAGADWSITMVIAILVAAAAGVRYIPKRSSLKAALNAGAIGSLLAIMNTASEVGYGNVIATTPGFLEIADSLLNIGDGMPLFNAAIMVNLLAGVIGSASGGLSIALEIFGQHWIEACTAMGIPVEVLHRIVAMASGGLDSLPHNGGVITILAVCGLTHVESYKDVFAITVFKILVAFFGVALFMITGIV